MPLRTLIQPLAVLPGEARLFDQLKRKGIQIHDVHIPAWGGLFVTIIQMTGLIEEQVREALMMTLFRPVLLFTKTAIAVDDDIATSMTHRTSSMHWGHG